jgi:hypothetical protein
VSDKTVTEREAVLRERAAAVDAFAAGYNTVLRGNRGVREYANQWAADAHPLPKVTRPRVVRDRMGREWRVWMPEVMGEEPVFQQRGGPTIDYAWDDWRNVQDVPAYAVRLLTDLLNDPVETVEAES